MPPNPPEEFSPVNVTSSYAEDTAAAQIYSTPKLTSKRRATNPYNSSSFQTSNLNNNMSTTITTTATINGVVADSSRIDTEFVINGYSSSQQVKQQGPTRKRSFSKPSQEGHTLSSAVPNIHRFGIAKNEMQNLDNKPNGLIGILRQHEEEKVNLLNDFISENPYLREKYNRPSAKTENPIITFKEIIINIFKSLNYDTLKFLVYCLLWYASSAITNNTGKQLLNQFNYPVTLTWIQFGFVGFYCYSFGQGMGLTKIRCPTVDIIRRTLPLCLFQIGSHVFSSIATSQVPVSFVHTIKVSTK
jgi:hypothetical protein